MILNGLSVTGFVTIPKDHQLKDIAVGKGVYLDFYVAFPGKDNNGNPLFHRYRANMWVPEDTVQNWREQIAPGSVFYIHGGFWSAVEKEGIKYPMNQLKLNHTGFALIKSGL